MLFRLCFDLKAIALNYVKGFFFLDFFSSIPFDLFLPNLGSIGVKQAVPTDF